MTADLDAIRARLAAAIAATDPALRWAGGDRLAELMGAREDLIANAPADLAALADEVEALRAAVHRVRALHHAHACPDGPTPSLTACAIIHGGTCAKVGTCSGCSQRHPCPTLDTLDGAS